MWVTEMGLGGAQMVVATEVQVMPYRQNVGKRHNKAGDTDGHDVDGRTPGTSIRVFKIQKKHAKEVKGEKGKKQTGLSTGKIRRHVNEHTHNSTWFLQIKRVKKLITSGKSAEHREETCLR